VTEKATGAAKARQALVERLLELSGESSPENNLRLLNQMVQTLLWPLREALSEEQMEAIGRRFAEKMLPQILAARRAALLSEQFSDDQLRALCDFLQQHPWVSTLTATLQRAVEESSRQQCPVALQETFVELGIGPPQQPTEGQP
jgi:hypothetical protein